MSGNTIDELKECILSRLTNPVRVVELDTDFFNHVHIFLGFYADNILITDMIIESIFTLISGCFPIFCPDQIKILL